ncbi:MAG: UDP-N-acetylglucosamine 2-epimerase, partial [Euryarchaeota archaeon RBG_13_31_8]
ISKKTALKENIDKNKIFVTGNTIVDAVLQNKNIASKNSKILERLKLKTNEYFLITVHRQENVDFKENLKDILIAFDKIYKKYRMPMIYPMHPRTQKMIRTFKLKIPKTINVIEPVGFLDFLQLEANARLILTDSGGIQEESCILKIPCVTLRENTERPETLEVGSNILSGTNPNRILNSVDIMMKKKREWMNPLGDGKTSKLILKIIKST